MKKIVLFAVPAAALLLLMGSSKPDAAAEAASTQPPVRSMEVPEQLEFAGERFDLTRYDRHERYDREINSFTYLHSTTMLLIKRANRFFPIIEPILRANGVPEDIKYLCVIESSLNHRAVSSAGAAGLWQFMKSTAPNYGLEVSEEVDERFSVVKSTEAACRYILEAYGKYGNWASAALSYNAGQGRISGELTKQLAEHGLDLWLVEETSRYFYRMLAIKQIFENPSRYGFIIREEQLYKPVEYTVVNVNSTIDDLALFASENGVTYAQLKDFNSWLRDRKLTVPSKSKSEYRLAIPTRDFLYYDPGKKIKVHDRTWLSRR